MNKLYLIFLFLFTASPLYSGKFSLQIPTRVETPGKKYLAADLHSSDTTIARPVVLIQTPYNKNFHPLTIDTLLYHVVIMDWRGFYANSDADSSQYDRGIDGYDAVEWIAGQSWCNGKVGTTGASALGAIQFQTARHHPPHLICANPVAKDFKTLYSNYFYGGVLRTEHVEQLQKLGFISTSLITQNPYYSFVWEFIENNSDYADEIEVPMLLISGWFDHYPSDILRAFRDLQTMSNESVRDRHKLIFGPWLHSSIGRTKQGELEYPDADNSAEMINRFLDYYLLGAKNGWPMEPVIQYYQMGENVWKTAEDWDEETQYSDSLFLLSGGSLIEGPYPLTFAEVEPDTIIYDPRNPSPTIGGSRFNPFVPSTPIGPMDISVSVEGRSDALIFSSEALMDNLVITGKSEIILFVSSDRKDTDIAVRLCDVYPDGRSIILTQGIKRMRFRNSYESDELLENGKIYPVSVELSDLAHTFLKGHKMRLVVTSSNYPMFDINLNNGGALYEAGDTLTATNLIYANNDFQSRIVFQTNIQASDYPDYYVPEYYAIDISPNPIVSSGIIHLTDLQAADINITLFDICGTPLCTLLDRYLNDGDYNIPVNMQDYPGGLYYIIISTNHSRQAIKILHY